MTYKIIADPDRCQKCCDEPCVAAYPPWGTWGKGCVIDRDDPECAEIWNGAMAARSACPHNAIESIIVQNNI